MPNKTLIMLEQTFSQAWTDALYSFILFIPRLFISLFVLFVGLTLSKLTYTSITSLFKSDGVQKLLNYPSVSLILKQLGLTKKLSRLVASSFSFLVLAAFVILAINLLGLSAVSTFILAVFSFIPNLLTAMLILFLGLLLTGFVEKVVKTSLSGFDLHLSRVIAKITSYIIFVITILATLRQLGIAQSFIDVIFTGFIATITLAVGLGFGLGSKDLIARILDKWYEQYTKDQKKSSSK